MNAEVIAEWYRRQGYQILRTESTFWCHEGMRVFQAFPWHWEIAPSQQEISRFMLQHGVLGIRYSCPVNAPIGMLSYRTLYQGGTYDLHDLPHQARNGIKKGLQHVSIEPISFDLLATEGWNLMVETLTRQHRQHEEDRESWRLRCQAAADLPGFEAWGAMAGKHLAAALLAVTCDDCYTFLNHLSATEYLKYHVNNAMTYVVTHSAINRPNISMIFYGLQSLQGVDGVDCFKLRMGYQASPTRQRIQFHPVITPFLNQDVHRFVRSLTTRYPHNTRLAKAEGCLRFFLEGKHSINGKSHPDL